MENYHATIGIDFKFKTLRIDDSVCKLQIWDTAGQEKFKTLTTSYYKGSHAVVLVCDQTSYVVCPDRRNLSKTSRSTGCPRCARTATAT